jgi:hypothetical protein
VSALAFLAPWIIVRAAFIGVVRGNPSLSAASPAVMQRVRGAGDRGSAAVEAARVGCFRCATTVGGGCRTASRGNSWRKPEGLCSCRAAYHSLLEMFMGRKIIQAAQCVLRILP